jgi:hypothetical protein
MISGGAGLAVADGGHDHEGGHLHSGTASGGRNHHERLSANTVTPIERAVVSAVLWTSSKRSQ